MHCDNPDWVKLSKDILKETGAEDIASAGEASADFAKSSKPMRRRATHRVDEVKHDKTQPPAIDEKHDDTVELESPLTKRLSGSS